MSTQETLTAAELAAMGQRARDAAALADAATAGPWYIDTDHGGVYSASLFVDITKSFDYEDGQDSTFIAASRTAVPALAADVAALLAYVAALEAERAVGVQVAAVIAAGDGG